MRGQKVIPKRQQRTTNLHHKTPPKKEGLVFGTFYMIQQLMATLNPSVCPDGGRSNE
jgi:hypothetical protein